jgi:predicted SnoaL-like aldol condensation-catalyzing enzyme
MMLNRAIVLLLALAPWTVWANGNACGRACLEGFAQKYLAALVGHDPSQLKWSGDALFSENGVPLNPGEALWSTITEVSPVSDFAVDPESGNISLFASIMEGKRPALLSARLRISHGAVAELETVVARKETSTFLVPSLPAVEEAKPSSDAAAMIAAASAYLAAIVNPEAPIPPLSKRCQRIENGVQTTNNQDPLPGVNPSPLRPEVTGLDCAEQFHRGLLKFVTRVRDVRMPVVDRARGIINAMLIFDHDGKPRPAAPGAPALSSGLQSPYSFVVSERFQFEADGIGRITAIITQVPFGTSGVTWAAAAPALGATASGPSQAEANKQLVLDMWRGVIEQKDEAAVLRYIAPDYIQHSTQLPNGRDGLLEGVRRLRNPLPGAPPHPHKTLVAAIAEGDLVALFWTRPVPNPAKPGQTMLVNACDMFRVKNGLVAEHWSDDGDEVR